MDKNAVQGLVLIALVIVLWTIFFAPPPPPPPQPIVNNQPAIDSLARLAQRDTIKQKPADTISQDQQLAERFGKFAPLARGSRKMISVETDKLRLSISTAGGFMQPVELTEFVTYSGEPLPVFPKGANNHFSFQLVHQNKTIDTRDLFFVPNLSSNTLKVSGADAKQLSLKAEIAPGKYLEHVYTFYGDRYEVGYQFRIAGLEEYIRNNIYYLNTVINVPITERSYDKMRPEVTLWWKVGDEISSLDAASEESEKKNIPGSVKWVSFKSQYFSMALLADKNFGGSVVHSVPAVQPGTVKRLEASLEIPYRRQKVDTVGMRVYFGPNDFYQLAAFNEGLHKQVSLGWGPLYWINAYLVYPTFRLLENIFSNYGLVILFMAILLKLVLLPLTFRSTLSMAKMQVVNNLPEIKEIDEKFKDNPTQAQQQKFYVYRQLGVNPMGGCLPLLLQLPFQIAMFFFFPAIFELRQKSFLWADDLSTYDSVYDFGFNVPFYGDHVSLFTLIMTAAQIALTWFMSKIQNQKTPPQMQVMQYVLPIIFLGLLNNYSAGLSYYYLLTIILQMIQTWLMRGFVSEAAIMARIEAYRQQRKAYELARAKANQSQKSGNKKNQPKQPFYQRFGKR